mgnify:CR=1 FL=1
MAEEGGDTVFVPGTSVNGLGIADLTVDEAAERIGSFYTKDYTLTIKERGGKTETITGDQIGFSVKLPDGFLQEKLNQQNAAGRVFGPDVDNKYKTDMISSFQKEQLEQAIGALDCITGNGMTAAADARISDYAEGEAFTVIPEIRGNQVDPEKAAEAIRAAVHTGAMEVDLEALAAGAESEDAAWLARYFDSVAPTKKNEYTGRFRGYNVIQLSIEGFSGYAIDPELTPTLYRLTHEGFVFPNFYTPLHYTSTSGGECQNLLGLYPKAGNPITMKETGVRYTDCRFSLARQLGALGYTVLGYHGNEDMYGRYASHTNLGYTWKQYQTGLELEMTADGSTYAWPQSDVYVAKTSMEDYLSLDSPFHVYYMTISGHMPYNFNRVASKYRDLVEPLPYSETTKAYLATAIEADRMLQTLLDGLEQAGELDNTLIVACADHIPYFNVDTLEELSGQSFGSSEDMERLDERSVNFDVYRSALILWAAGMEEPVVVDKPCGQVDILPTVSNLLGLEYDSRMLAGSDLLSDAPGLVIFSSRSWLTDRGFYDRYTQTFTPAEGGTMTPEEQAAYVDAMKRTVQYKLGCTEKILNSDFYRLAFGG